MTRAMQPPKRITYKGATYELELPKKIKVGGKVYRIADDVPPPPIPPKVEKKKQEVVPPNIQQIQTDKLAQEIMKNLENKSGLIPPESLLEKLKASIKKSFQQARIPVMASAGQLKFRLAGPKPKTRYQPQKRPLNQANPVEVATQYAAQLVQYLEKDIVKALKAIGVTEEKEVDAKLDTLEDKLVDNLTEAFKAA